MWGVVNYLILPVEVLIETCHACNKGRYNVRVRRVIRVRSGVRV
jgi:hypothetical protein